MTATPSRACASVSFRGRELVGHDDDVRQRRLEVVADAAQEVALEPGQPAEPVGPVERPGVDRGIVDRRPEQAGVDVEQRLVRLRPVAAGWQPTGEARLARSRPGHPTRPARGRRRPVARAVPRLATAARPPRAAARPPGPGPRAGSRARSKIVAAAATPSVSTRSTPRPGVSSPIATIAWRRIRSRRASVSPIRSRAVARRPISSRLSAGRRTSRSPAAIALRPPSIASIRRRRRRPRRIARIADAATASISPTPSNGSSRLPIVWTPAVGIVATNQPGRRPSSPVRAIDPPTSPARSDIGRAAGSEVGSGLNASAATWSLATWSCPDRSNTAPSNPVTSRASTTNAGSSFRANASPTGRRRPRRRPARSDRRGRSAGTRRGRPRRRGRRRPGRSAGRPAGQDRAAEPDQRGRRVGRAADDLAVADDQDDHVGLALVDLELDDVLADRLEIEGGDLVLEDRPRRVALGRLVEVGGVASEDGRDAADRRPGLRRAPPRRRPPRPIGTRRTRRRPAGSTATRSRTRMTSRR